jgi:hypothetical protein
MSAYDNIDEAIDSVLSTVGKMPWSDDEKSESKSIIQAAYDEFTGPIDSLYLTFQKEDLTVSTATYQAGKFWERLYGEFSSQAFDYFNNIDKFRDYLASSLTTTQTEAAQDRDTNLINNVSDAVSDTADDIADIADTAIDTGKKITSPPGLMAIAGIALAILVLRFL